MEQELEDPLCEVDVEVRDGFYSENNLSVEHAWTQKFWHKDIHLTKLHIIKTENSYFSVITL